MLAYAITIFVAAFLLFQVQPLMGKYVLPWFGGGPDVWTVCMLFFQTVLLAGYAYAHLSARLFSARAQAVVHLVLIAAALALLPIAPSASGQPAADNPTLQIVLLLAVSIGLPYFVLASTSPLMQNWLSRTGGAMPYRLYALSNAASLAALVGYPFVIEPFLSRSTQAWLWSGAMCLFGAASATCAWKVWRCGKSMPSGQAASSAELSTAAAPPAISTRLLWLALPTGAAVVLLAVTNKICLDIAPMPFLWIAPLSLYLLSFVICFDNPRWYARRAFVAAFIVSIVAVIYLRTQEGHVPIWGQLALYLAALFACCMVCHGELFRLRPAVRYLTSYYLTIATGGALGGLFVAVVAPYVFSTYAELYVGLLGCCLFVLLADPNPLLRRRRWVWGLLATAGMVAVALQPTRGGAGDKMAGQWRNFYGVLTLWDKYAQNADMHRLVMQNGTTFHGLQFVEPSRRLVPTAYYGPHSGVGLMLEDFPRKIDRRIGVIGLGVGTLATYGRAGDVIRFYEINPAVTRLAQTRFSYLGDSKAEIQIVMGDARLSLAREEPQQFDMLVLDAFSSDSVPVHLLTVEAFDVYLRHLRPDGVVAVHVSNCHLDLAPVLARLAARFDLQCLCIKCPGDEDEGLLASRWVLLSKNAQFLRDITATRSPEQVDPVTRTASLWTDDHVRVLEILK